MDLDELIKKLVGLRERYGNVRKLLAFVDDSSGRTLELELSSVHHDKDQDEFIDFGLDEI